MSIIFIKSNDDKDLTAEQLELLHRYSDQARVWAFLLLKEAGILRSPEEWQEVRQKWISTKDQLKSINNSYADAVLKALQTDFQSGKSPAQTILPDPTSFFKEPSEVEAAQKVAEEEKKLFADLYPSKEEVKFRGPFMTSDEMKEVLLNPEAAGLDPEKMSFEGPMPPQDLAVGFAINQKVVDPHTGARAEKTDKGANNVAEDFASAVLSRALQQYNPHLTEDTGAGFEGQPASFGTYLYRAMVNERNSRTTSYNQGKGADVSLSQPSSEDFSQTLEESVADDAKEKSIDFEEYLPKLREWLDSKVSSKFTQAAADRLYAIYEKLFLKGERLTDITRDLQIGNVDRPREKEIPLMQSLGIDISSLPEKAPESVTEDRIQRQHLWVDFFKDLRDKISMLERKPEKTPEESQQLGSLKDLLKKASDGLDKLGRPNVARTHNLFWGHPRAATTHKSPYLTQFLYQFPEWQEILDKARARVKKSTLEDFLRAIPKLRVEGGLNYGLLRNKIQQKLESVNKQLFAVYSYLYEKDFSNPDTSRVTKLSPPRITGIKNKIIATLLELPEIQNIFEDTEEETVSPLRRLLYKEGDTVKVNSINEVGSISEISDSWYKVHLNNGNDVLTLKADIQKHCTLIASAQDVLKHYFDREAIVPQCYLSLIASETPKLAILELRPISEDKTSVRLHIDNNLVDITEISEKYPDNLISILKGYIGVNAKLDTPFTSLFEEIEDVKKEAHVQRIASVDIQVEGPHSPSAKVESLNWSLGNFSHIWQLLGLPYSDIGSVSGEKLLKAINSSLANFLPQTGTRETFTVENPGHAGVTFTGMSEKEVDKKLQDLKRVAEQAIMLERNVEWG